MIIYFIKLTSIIDLRKFNFIKKVENKKANTKINKYKIYILNKKINI